MAKAPSFFQLKLAKKPRAETDLHQVEYVATLPIFNVELCPATLWGYNIAFSILIQNVFIVV